MATGTQDTPLLAIKNLTIRFGGILALDDVSFEVRRRIICGIIGPNGSGKTTLFNCLSRLYHPTSGYASFDQQPLFELPAHRLAALGIGRTFQNLALFRSLTVRQNVLIGGHSQGGGSFLTDALRLPRAITAERKLKAYVDDLLQMLNLTEYADRIVSSLPFGTQKRVELARALASGPKLLMLDEPAAGLNHEEVDALASLIVSMRDQLAMTVLLVEHHMNLVMRLSDHVVVLNFGQIISEGPPTQVQHDPEVIRAYLGGGE